MSWLKTSNFAFVFMPSFWYWCALMQYNFNFGNWKQMKYFSDFFFILSFYFFLYWASFSYLSSSSPPLPLSGSGWFLGIFKLRHTWGMRKLMLFSKSFFFFSPSDLFVHLKLHLIFHYYRSFHLISWIFFPLEKNLQIWFCSTELWELVILQPMTVQ